MNEAILLTEPTVVGNRLEQLGLTREIMISGIDAMVGGRASCTLNDAPSAPGYMSWNYGTRRMREELIPLGWERSEEGQLSSVYNRKLNIKLIVCNTDEGTGLPDRAPAQRSKKGLATELAVYGNQVLVQQNFMPALEPTMSWVPRRAGDQPVCWYLCVCDMGSFIRAELSCPVSIEDGYFTGFIERLVLIGPNDDYDSGVRVISDSPSGGGDGLEINVTRKSA
jgi:hypothetical protein